MWLPDSSTVRRPDEQRKPAWKLRALPLLLLATCTLDPGGVVSSAVLKVRAFDLVVGGRLEVTTLDSRAHSRTKKTPVTDVEMEILYEAGSLAAGDLALSAEAFDAEGNLVGC